jgi:hypothetical protein
MKETIKNNLSHQNSIFLMDVEFRLNDFEMFISTL